MYRKPRANLIPLFRRRDEDDAKYCFCLRCRAAGKEEKDSVNAMASIHMPLRWSLGNHISRPTCPAFGYFFSGAVPKTLHSPSLSDCSMNGLVKTRSIAAGLEGGGKAVKRMMGVAGERALIFSANSSPFIPGM